MYYQSNGNITVWSSQSLASHCNLININRFKQNKKPKAVYAEVNKNNINWYCRQFANDLIANSEENKTHEPIYANETLTERDATLNTHKIRTTSIELRTYKTN